MDAEIVRYELTDGIAVIRMDDGKANALSPAMLEALDIAFKRAAEEAPAAVLLGREGRFCAGFDLGVMMSGPEGAKDLVVQGTDVMMNVYELPIPVVIGCTGHAIAGGALMLATADIRIGVDGPFKIGLNEVANSMPVPILAHRLAQDRLRRNALVESVMHSRIYNPQEAADVGWLDRVVGPDALFDAVLTEAQRLAQLPSFSYSRTKKSVRRASIEHIRSTVEENMNSILSGF